MGLTRSKFSKTQAFTALELLICLAIMAIFFGWSLPSLQMLIRNSQTTSESVELISLLQFTKGVAILRNTEVPVEITSEDGYWRAIVQDPAEEADVEGCVPGQLRCNNFNNVNLTLHLPGNGSVLVFDNRGYIVNPDDPLVFVNGIIFMEHHLCEGQRQRYRIQISPTGQVTSCSLACGDTETECTG